jgi:hypothetical protein
VPVFLERYILPVLATATIGIIVLNPFSFDWRQRASLFVAVVALAFFVGHTIHRSGQTPETTQEHRPITAPAPPPVQETAKDTTVETPKEVAPIIHQHSEGPNSPNIIGSNNQIINTEPPARRLSDGQIAKLVTALSDFPEVRVKLLTYPGGAEVEQFAADFRNLFKQLHWRITSDEQSLVGDRYTGLTVVAKSNEEHPKAAQVLPVKLREMGFQVGVTGDPRTLSEDEIRLIIWPLK